MAKTGLTSGRFGSIVASVSGFSVARSPSSRNSGWESQPRKLLPVGSKSVKVRCDMERITNQQYSIQGAFSECFYVVPDYQREYVWKEKEIQQLLDDINDQIESGSDKPYFVGMTLVSPGSHGSQFEVIDGQQRLTTFFLLLCALKSLFKGSPMHDIFGRLISSIRTTKSGDPEESLRLDPRYDGAGDLIKTLVQEDDEPEKVMAAVRKRGIRLFGSLKNLLDAYDTVYRYMQSNYGDETRIKKFWGYLANKVVFIQISTDVSSALKIFETVNERGIGLNPMDLLKNLLFAQVGSDDFSKLKDEWKRITAPLEKAKQKPLRFLRYFLMANYEVRHKGHIVREDEIYDWLVDRANADLCGYKDKPFDFVRKIIRNAENYLYFVRGLGNNGAPNVPMANLKELCGGSFSQHYVLLLSVADLPKDLFDHFVGQLENFLFFYIFTKAPTRDLERNFSVWADELRDIAEKGDVGEQKSMLNGFIQNRFQSGMADKSAELVDALKRYSMRSMQKYRTRYLLAKLTQHVDMKYRGVDTPGALEPYMKLEIEHILPSSPEQDLREDFLATNPGVDYDEYKNRLGNLTLLEKPINIVASNDFYEAKKPEYEKCQHYLTTSIAGINTVGKNSSINRINKKLKSFSDWSACSIDKRQDMLIDLAKDVWKTSLLDV